MSTILVDKLAHRFEPADSWQPPSMVDADIIGYYRSSLDGDRMVLIEVDGDHLHYRVADLAVSAAPACRAVTIMRDDAGEECGRIVDDRDLNAMSDDEYEDFLYDEARELDEEYEREREAEAAAHAQIVRAAQVRAAHADRAYDVACREYCSRHLGTAIRAQKDEKQHIRRLFGDALEAAMSARELTEALA